MSHALGGNNVSSRLIGDGNPKLFDFNTLITQKELMNLYITSDKLEKGVKWIPAMILTTGWEFKKLGPFMAQKFKKDFAFESFTDWFKWSGAYEEALNAMAWANLFRRAIVIGYLAEETPSEYKGKPYYDEIEQGTDICTKVEAMYSILNGNGWEIAEENEDNEPEIYKITKTNYEENYVDCDHVQEQLIHYVHASRVVLFTAPKKQMGFDGTAKSQTIAHLCKLQKQMLQAVYVQCKNLIAGYIIYRASNNTSATEINTLLDSFSHLTRLGWDGAEPLEDILKLDVPDFKADQLQSINLMIQKSLASAMNISIRNLGEEDIASGLGEGGAGISHELTLFEIKEMQRFYTRPLEHLFYIMGKTESAFVWNEPMVKDEKLKEEQKNKDLGDKDGKKEDDQKPEDKQTEA